MMKNLMAPREGRKKKGTEGVHGFIRIPDLRHLAEGQKKSPPEAGRDFYIS
jgi:hypothetical protein